APVGRQRVRREPPLDPQVAQVLLEDAPVPRAPGLLPGGMRTGAFAHRVTNGSIARATNSRARSAMEPWHTDSGASCLPLRPRRVRTAERTTRKPNQAPTSTAETP